MKIAELSPALRSEVERLRAIETKAFAQSDDVQVNWLSPVETSGLRAEVARLREALEAITELPPHGYGIEMCALMQRIAADVLRTP